MECPDQIGFLEICGERYPIVRGINKIGKDNKRCNIVLNKKTISKQHAIINQVGSKKYTLMDLESKYETKLRGDHKGLQPYIPYPLLNGDTIRFGQVLGIFRLLDEEDNLQTATNQQALHKLVVTPMVNKIKTESPDFSDKECHFSKEDNHEAETKIPSVNGTVDIQSTNTQIPKENLASPSIYSLETQIPLVDNLPEVENDNNIHNAETQLVSFSVEKPEETKTAILLCQPSSSTPKKSIQSDEEIIFDTFSLPPHSNADKEVAENVSRFSSTMELTDIVVGADVQINIPQRVPSDLSDVKETPKKVKPLKLMDTGLPDSLEIEDYVINQSINSKNVVKKESTEKDEMKILDDATVNLECNKNKPKRTKKIKMNVKKDSNSGIRKSIEIARKKLRKSQGSQIKTALEKNNSKEDNNKSHETREEKTRIVEKRNARTIAKPNEKYKNSRSDNSKTPGILDLRRSARLKTVKKEETPKHRASAEYVLSDSSIDSPKSLKRWAEKGSDVSRPKKSSNSKISKVSCLRPRPARCTAPPNVLFTACNEIMSSTLNELGATVVSEVMACTVVVSASVKLNYKLLCAAGLGRPIVDPSWVEACHKANMIVDPWAYLLEDEAAEKRWQFNLHRTLTGKRNFLKGYNVSCTPNVVPSEPEMKHIVECSGGTWIPRGMVCTGIWVCVSCSADKKLWNNLRKKNAVIVRKEFILIGVLRQIADITGNIYLT